MNIKDIPESILLRYKDSTPVQLEAAINAVDRNPNSNNEKTQQRLTYMRNLLALVRKAEKPKPITQLDVARKYTQLLESAERRGKDFNLTLSDVRKLLSRKTCYYTGKTFSLTNPRTVDRVDANKGYVKGNVVACTAAANQAKCFLMEQKENSAYIGTDGFLRMAKKLSK